jgi:molybdopterin converting factor small subunit
MYNRAVIKCISSMISSLESTREAAQVKLLWFSVLSEKRGLRSEFIPLPGECTIEEFLTQLSREHAFLKPYLNHLRVAVNQRYTDASAKLKANDEVALITPVSGG